MNDIKIHDGYNCSLCQHKHPLKAECQEKTFCALEVDRIREQVRASVIDECLKAVNEHCGGLPNPRIISCLEELKGKKDDIHSMGISRNS